MNMHAITHAITSIFTKKPKNGLKQSEITHKKLDSMFNKAMQEAYNASNEAKQANSDDNMPALIVQKEKRMRIYTAGDKFPQNPTIKDLHFFTANNNWYEYTETGWDNRTLQEQKSVSAVKSDNSALVNEVSQDPEPKKLRQAIGKQGKIEEYDIGETMKTAQPIGNPLASEYKMLLDRIISLESTIGRIKIDTEFLASLDARIEQINSDTKRRLTKLEQPKRTTRMDEIEAKMGTDNHKDTIVEQLWQHTMDISMLVNAVKQLKKKQPQRINSKTKGMK